VSTKGIISVTVLFYIAVGLYVFAVPKHRITFKDACTCDGCHGIDRWDAKTDTEAPPWGIYIKSITPLDVAAWKPPSDEISTAKDSPRLAEEEAWYSLTGRIDLIRVEQDGDLHIQLQDEHNIVVVEVPLGDIPAWCEIRKKVFSWTKQTFALSFGTSKTLELNGKEPKLLTVTGKRFWDTDHAPKDQSKRRPGEPDVLVWEIHPVMDIK